MKLYLFVNAQKLLLVFYLVWMMFRYDNFSTTAFVYVSLHGCYGYIWFFIKHLAFPNRSFDIELDAVHFVGYIVVAWGLIPLIPSYCLSNRADASNVLIAASLITYTFGINLMMVADCQLFYSLRLRPGHLVKDGMNKFIYLPRRAPHLFIIRDAEPALCVLPHRARALAAHLDAHEPQKGTLAQPLQGMEALQARNVDVFSESDPDLRRSDIIMILCRCTRRVPTILPEFRTLAIFNSET